MATTPPSRNLFVGAAHALAPPGEEFCRVYSLVKRQEYEKFRTTVTDDERRLYAEFL